MAVLDLIRTTDPAELLTVEQGKGYLKIEDDDAVEDEVIKGLIDGAVGLLDGYDGRLGRALVAQGWTLHLPAFPCGRAIKLPLPPLISVQSLEYRAADGSWLTLSTDAYEVVAGPAALIVLRTGFAWPSTVCGPRAVRIVFTAGYGEPNKVPKAIVSAVKLLLGWAYADREGATPEPVAVKRLLAGYRVPKV